jgi:hypothetical protein
LPQVLLQKTNFLEIILNFSSKFNGTLIGNSLDNQRFLLIPTSDVIKDNAIAPSYYIISKYNSEALTMSMVKSPEKDPIKKLINSLTKNQEDNRLIIRYYPFKATLDQQWMIKKLEGYDEGFYEIFNCLYDKVIALSNQNLFTPSDYWMNLNSQKWRIVPIESAILPALAQPEIRSKGEIVKNLPNLTGYYEDIPYETTPRILSEKYVPCIYVNDPNENQDKAKTNPWYRLRFSQFWRKDDNNPPIELDDTRTREIKVKHVIGSQIKKIEKFEEIVNKKISAEIRASIEVYRGSAGGSWEKLNGKSQILEDGFYAEDTYEDKVIFHSNKRKIIYLYQMIDQYTVLDRNGNLVCELDVQTPTTREVPYPNDEN